MSTPLDLHNELDAAAIGRSRGAAGGAGGRPGPIDEATLTAQIRSGEAYHQPTLTLAALWAYEGKSFAAAAKALQALYDEVPAVRRDQRWRTRRADIFRLVWWVYEREAAKPEAGLNGAAFGPESAASLGAGGTAAELARKNLPVMRWRVADLVPEEGLTLVIGKPKVRKSWLVHATALDCAAGTRALGRYQTRKCAVLFLGLEDHERRLQARQLKLLAGKPAPSNLIYGYDCPAGSACLTTLAAWLDQHPDVGLVCLDPFARVRGPSDGRRNAFQQDYADFAALAAFANQRRIALVVVHHARKATADDPLDRINGTMAVPAAADTIMVLTPDRGTTTATLSITGKDIENDGDLALSWDADTCRWTVLGEAGAVRAETMQDKMVAYLRERAEPVGVAEIADELDISQGTARKMLSRLRLRGFVTPLERGRWQVCHG
jgi:hypothetical protein